MTKIRYVHLVYFGKIVLCVTGSEKRAVTAAISYMDRNGGPNEWTASISSLVWWKHGDPDFKVRIDKEQVL